MRLIEPRYVADVARYEQVLAERGIRLADDARRMPIFMAAGSGSGKSRLLGRLLAWRDFTRGLPVVVLDPHGMTIENLLDKLSRLPLTVPVELRAQLWQRIRYVDMSGQSGHVVPFPLYYRLDKESLYERAQRYIDVVGKIDPHLRTASIEGFNAFKTVGTNVGMLLAALGGQITEATHMLQQPEIWLERAKRELDMQGEAWAALPFLTQYADLNPGSRHRQNASFMNKISLFELDPVLRAMFGSNRSGLDWQEVVDKHQLVLLDFRHVHDLERRQFLMMWVYHYFMSFIRARGAGRHQPISFIVDELAALFPMSGLVADQFAGDLDEMINQVARNYSLYLTLATQELYQFSERLQKTLLSMTLILGRTSDPEAAAMTTQRLERYDPYQIKKYENVWGSVLGMPLVVEKRPVEFTPEEQLILGSYRYLDLRKFEFVVRLPSGEGDMAGGVRRLSIAGLDPGHFPQAALVAEARARLTRRDWPPLAQILAELDSRRQAVSRAEPPRQPIPASGEVDP